MPRLPTGSRGIPRFTAQTQLRPSSCTRPDARVGADAGLPPAPDPRRTVSVLARSVGNAFRNKVRTAAVVAVLAVAIGLALAMLVANQAVGAKVQELNASVGTVLTVNPAGGQGFEGGGEPLTVEQAATAAAVPNVSSVVGTRPRTAPREPPPRSRYARFPSPQPESAAKWTPPARP